MSKSKVEVYTQEIDECSTILQQELVNQKYMKEILAYKNLYNYHIDIAYDNSTDQEFNFRCDFYAYENINSVEELLEYLQKTYSISTKSLTNNKCDSFSSIISGVFYVTGCYFANDYIYYEGIGFDKSQSFGAIPVTGFIPISQLISANAISFEKIQLN